MVGRGGQRVLVGATVDLMAQELLGGGVGDGPDRHLRRGQLELVVGAAGNPEVGQQDSALLRLVDIGEHDIGRFDVAVQQSAFVGVIQG